jgi:hypothetical protein
MLALGWLDVFALPSAYVMPARINAPAAAPPCWCGGVDRLTIPYLPVLDPALETFYSP